MKTIYRDNNENRLDQASIDWLKVQATVTSYDAVNQVQHVKVLLWDDLFQGQDTRLHPVTNLITDKQWNFGKP